MTSNWAIIGETAFKTALRTKELALILTTHWMCHVRHALLSVHHKNHVPSRNHWAIGAYCASDQISGWNERYVGRHPAVLVWACLNNYVIFYEVTISPDIRELLPNYRCPQFNPKGFSCQLDPEAWVHCKPEMWSPELVTKAYCWDVISYCLKESRHIVPSNWSYRGEARCEADETSIQVLTGRKTSVCSLTVSQGQLSGFAEGGGQIIDPPIEVEMCTTFTVLQPRRVSGPGGLPAVLFKVQGVVC